MSVALVTLWTDVKKRLEAAGVEMPVFDARLLVEVGANVSRMDIVTDPRRILTDEQVAALQRISDSLSTKLDSMAAALQDTVTKLVNGNSDFQQIFPKIQPHLQEARNLYLAALKSAEKVLTPEQWKQLPEAVRNPTLRRGPGAGGGQGERRQRPPG